MLSFKTELRVRYADTDMMQFVYNAKYLEYFEVGRTELIRSTGLSYNEIEIAGYQMPLIEARVFYKTPLLYDEIISIETTVNELYSAKIYLHYNIYKEDRITVAASGYTVHMFINSKTKKPVKPPKIYIDALKPFFNS